MKRLIFIIITALIFQSAAEEKVIPQLTVKLELVRKSLELEKFHEHHTNEFVKADGFGERRVVILPKQYELVLDGGKYVLTDMKLLSTTDRKKPVVWEFPGGKNKFSIFSTLNKDKIKDGHMKKRPIADNELKDMKKLKEGEDWVLHKDQRDLRIVAPLHGGPTCIRCHEDYKEGEFMGAFIYDLTVVDKVPYINKEDKPVKKKELSKLLQKK